jgi:hypothetical protein
VSVGLAEGDAVVLAAPDEAALSVAADVDVLAVLPDPPLPDPPAVHAARAAAAPPAPRKMPSERRLMRVERSNSRPRSWSGCGM